MLIHSLRTITLQLIHIFACAFSHCSTYRQEHSQSGKGTEEGGGQSSPQVHIRKLCGPGAYGGGASDYADGDTASITTSGPRAASTAHEVLIRLLALENAIDSVVHVAFFLLVVKVQTHATPMHVIIAITDWLLRTGSIHSGERRQLHRRKERSRQHQS